MTWLAGNIRGWRVTENAMPMHALKNATLKIDRESGLPYYDLNERSFPYLCDVQWVNKRFVTLHPPLPGYMWIMYAPRSALNWGPVMPQKKI